MEELNKSKLSIFNKGDDYQKLKKKYSEIESKY